MTLEMFGSRFSVLPLERPEEETSRGGIVIPVTVDMAKNAQGIVVGVGDGLLLQDGTKVPLPVKPGDHVLYRKHAGAPVDVGGEQLVVLDLENLLGILRAGDGRMQRVAETITVNDAGALEAVLEPAGAGAGV